MQASLLCTGYSLEVIRQAGYACHLEAFCLGTASCKVHPRSVGRVLASMGAMICPPKAVALQNLAALQDTRLHYQLWIYCSLYTPKEFRQGFIMVGFTCAGV